MTTPFACDTNSIPGTFSIPFVVSDTTTTVALTSLPFECYLLTRILQFFMNTETGRQYIRVWLDETASYSHASQLFDPSCRILFPLFVARERKLWDLLGKKREPIQWYSISFARRIIHPSYQAKVSLRATMREEAVKGVLKLPVMEFVMEFVAGKIQLPVSRAALDTSVIKHYSLSNDKFTLCYFVVSIVVLLIFGSGIIERISQSSSCLTNLAQKAS